MSEKRKIIVALIIVIAAILFVVLNPKLLKTFTESFSNAYNHAQEEKALDEGENTEDEFTVLVPDVKLEVINDAEGGYLLHIMPDTFKFVPPGGTLEEGEWGGHMLVYIRRADAKVFPPLREAEYEKQYVAYTEWVHLEGIQPGAYHMKVVLVDTNNQVIAVEGGPGDFFYSLDFTVPLSN